MNQDLDLLLLFHFSSTTIDGDSKMGELAEFVIKKYENLHQNGMGLPIDELDLAIENSSRNLILKMIRGSLDRTTTGRRSHLKALPRDILIQYFRSYIWENIRLKALDLIDEEETS
jgi:hypothetical protein